MKHEYDLLTGLGITLIDVIKNHIKNDRKYSKNEHDHINIFHESFLVPKQNPSFKKGDKWWCYWSKKKVLQSCFVKMTRTIVKDWSSD